MAAGRTGAGALGGKRGAASTGGAGGAQLGGGVGSWPPQGISLALTAGGPTGRAPGAAWASA
eukprot:12249612-Alexandrium_andersonii.AAC.1